MERKLTIDGVGDYRETREVPVGAAHREHRREARRRESAQGQRGRQRRKKGSGALDATERAQIRALAKGRASDVFDFMNASMGSGKAAVSEVDKRGQQTRMVASDKKKSPAALRKMLLQTHERQRPCAPRSASSSGGLAGAQASRRPPASRDRARRTPAAQRRGGERHRARGREPASAGGAHSAPAEWQGGHEEALQVLRSPCRQWHTISQHSR